MQLGTILLTFALGFMCGTLFFYEIQPFVSTADRLNNYHYNHIT